MVREKCKKHMRADFINSTTAICKKCGAVYDGTKPEYTIDEIKSWWNTKVTIPEMKGSDVREEDANG